MSATPARVHWDSRLSPLSEGSTESYIATSSLDYLNAQLVAHGYTPSPGLSLEALSGTDSDRVVKCLLGMLSQRVEDMSRTEHLSTKFRTLTYDHERLLTMQRTANEKAANAEREMNLYKTKLTATIRTLQSTEAAHKQTAAELQRTRTSFQALRATHQTELRKKERDIERMTEKWSKISDSQTKLASVPAGLRCANVTAVDGSEFMGKSQRYLETALDEAEKARAQLTDETMRLRRLVLKVVNQVQTLLHQVRGFISDKDEEPTTWTITNLFPMHPPTHAHDTLTSILNSLKDTLAILPQHIASSPSTSAKPFQPNHEEITRLQDTISQLRKEIERSQKQSQAQAAETQAMFDKFVIDHKKASDGIAEMSLEFMTAPMIDEERERLDRIKQELDEEREKFTQAAIKLGKERAALEAERNKVLDEKRSWQVQQMLADLPPSPDPLRPHQPQARSQSHKSPRKVTQTHVHTLVLSPSKKSPKKARRPSATRKATRISRRSSITPVKPDIIPSYETELIPPQLHLHELQAPPPPPPLAALSFSHLRPAASILPSFVLPPPSPNASLPSKPILPPQPTSPPDFGGNDTLYAHVPPEEHVQPTSSSAATDSESVAANTNLTTPARRPFPMAKPFAQRMIHAYSPAKPSPLSRILMLGNSPDTPEEILSTGDISPGLNAVREEVEESERDENPFPVFPETPKPLQMSLAAELGVESPPDIVEVVEVPLKEKKTELNDRTKVSSKPGTTAIKKSSVGGGVKERPKSRTSSESARGAPVTSTRTSRGDGTEKENGVATTRRVSGKASTGAATVSSTARAVGSGRPTKPLATAPRSNPSGPTAKASVFSKPVAVNAGAGPGPRRVPVNSAEAPPITRRKS